MFHLLEFVSGCRGLFVVRLLLLGQQPSFVPSWLVPGDILLSSLLVLSSCFCLLPLCFLFFIGFLMFVFFFASFLLFLFLLVLLLLLVACSSCSRAVLLASQTTLQKQGFQKSSGGGSK